MNEGGSGSGLRVAIETLGCRSNYADSVDLQAALLEQGAFTCTFDNVADVYVINTCTVTDAADKEALRLVRRARAKSPSARIVVTGCLAEVQEDHLMGLSDVNCVVGPGRQGELVKAIVGEQDEQHPRSRAPLSKGPAPRRTISLRGPISQSIGGPGSLMGEIPMRARYHLRIQDGCENFCTFCIVPQTRGGFSSRPLEDLLSDIRHLADVGYREVVLSGTHLGGYGVDLGYSLRDLLEVLAEKSAISRIRLSSIDPNDLSPEIIDIFAQGNVFCPHLHICVQAFSDLTLKRMNRRYRMEDVREMLWYINQVLPNCCIGSDVITGFPGESRQEVDQGIEEFLRLPISYLHVFPYSERSGTAATRLKGSVPVAERRRRAARWRALGERRRGEYYSRLVGRELELIVERLDGLYAYGTSREYAWVKVPLRNETLQSTQGSVEECFPTDSGDDLVVGREVAAQVISYIQAERKLLCHRLNRESLE